ncbi:hypothetical protein M2323_004188 [Rhodoblastus acidophilus]|uniref:hypothetical protein n=1 Tax=Rhodoblastus acidophilus TaxID=1074 RepID=UPI00222407C5|nr:hypothetical protein [Rhodoblastus acidophilus]MCW2286393.1 hypothetical protein [Rhodoblastus acidophilus]MCW2335242.1 hypothetical protein [Rhodoblastus acidophilus]
MSRLGFSVEKKAPARPGRASDVREVIYRDQKSDLSFVASMFLLGLALLALGAFHNQAHALLGPIFGF